MTLMAGLTIAPFAEAMTLMAGLTIAPFAEAGSMRARQARIG